MDPESLALKVMEGGGRGREGKDGEGEGTKEESGLILSELEASPPSSPKSEHWGLVSSSRRECSEMPCGGNAWAATKEKSRCDQCSHVFVERCGGVRTWGFFYNKDIQTVFGCLCDVDLCVCVCSQTGFN